MKKLFSRVRKNTTQYGKDAAYSRHCILDCDRNLYREEYFKNMLLIERKRTERSRKPFLLMHLHIGKAMQGEQRGDFLRKLTDALSPATREIDIKGWVEHDRVLGIIFPEVNPSDKEPLQEKIRLHLEGTLGNKLADGIAIDCYIFPDEPGLKQKNQGGNRHFYPDISKLNGAVKRGVDISVSLIALIVLFPLLVVLALLVKLTSEGPVIFRQKRVGYLGKKFLFLKFRTMYADSDSSIHREYIKKFIEEQKCYSGDDGGNKCERVYKIKDDPRVTALGRILRKTSLDELPQFINVLKGDMSLVGPRPPIPYELENYDIWHKRRVLEVKPGITGLWQITGRSKTTFDEMVRLDLAYIREYSLWMDIKILLRTPLVVVTGKGSY